MSPELDFNLVLFFVRSVDRFVRSILSSSSCRSIALLSIDPLVNLLSSTACRLVFLSLSSTSLVDYLLQFNSHPPEDPIRCSGARSSFDLSVDLSIDLPIAIRSRFFIIMLVVHLRVVVSYGNRSLIQL